MAILVIMAASTADMVLLFDPANTSRVYYGTDTRLADTPARWLSGCASRGAEAAEAGAVRKMCRSGTSGPATRRAPVSLSSAMFLAPRLGGTADRILVRQRVSVVHVPGGYLITAFISLCALACAVNNDSIWSHVLGCAPYIESRSFSLYVMHYPLLQFMNPATRTQALPWWGWVLEAVVVLAASEAFYQLVEAARKIVQMPRSQHAKPLPKAGYRLRPGAWVMSVIGLVTVVALTWAPVDWNGIAQARAIGCAPNSRHPPAGQNRRSPSPSLLP